MRYFAILSRQVAHRSEWPVPNRNSSAKNGPCVGGGLRHRGYCSKVKGAVTLMHEARLITILFESRSELSSTAVGTRQGLRAKSPNLGTAIAAPDANHVVRS